MPSKSASSKRSGSRRRAAEPPDEEARSLSRPEHRPRLPRRSRPPQPRRESSASPALPPVVREVARWEGPAPDEELVYAVRGECRAIAAGASDAQSDGGVEFIYAMLRSGEDVNQHGLAGGYSPLAVAAAAGNRALVSLLLDKGADPAFASLERRELPLHLAVSNGHVLVCQLLAGPTRDAGLIDATNIAGWTPLHLATIAGRYDIARVLIGHGAKVSARGAAQGQPSATHLAARNGHSAVLEDLLNLDADPNATDNAGNTPLHLASTCLSDDCVAMLLRYRADPNLLGGPDGACTCLELVPQVEDPRRARIVKLLSAYERGDTRRRGDARFDLPVSKLPLPEGLAATAIKKLDDFGELLL